MYPNICLCTIEKFTFTIQEVSVIEMARLVLYVLCVVLLTTCAGTVSSDKSQGKTVQQLGDDPPCGTPVECYAQAIEALKEAEQKIEGLNNAILTLNQTLKQVVANQSQVNEQLKANQTQMKADIRNNSEAIAANKDAIDNQQDEINTNSNDISSNTGTMSDLTAYTCNCDNNGRYSGCGAGVSQGFDYYCDKTWCRSAWTPVISTGGDNIGITCCDICLGSSEEAKAYALAHPRPPPVAMECEDEHLESYCSVSNRN